MLLPFFMQLRACREWMIDIIDITYSKLSRQGRNFWKSFGLFCHVTFRQLFYYKKECSKVIKKAKSAVSAILAVFMAFSLLVGAAYAGVISPVSRENAISTANITDKLPFAFFI